jgi:hypothetical protein
VLVKLCRRQIFELPPGQWRGVARLSRGTPEIARVLYERPATIDVQYAVICRTPAAWPRLGDPIRIAVVRMRDRDWPSYDPRQHLRPDGSLVVDNFILELFDEEENDSHLPSRCSPSMHSK